MLDGTGWELAGEGAEDGLSWVLEKILVEETMNRFYIILLSALFLVSCLLVWDIQRNKVTDKQLEPTKQDVLRLLDAAVELKLEMEQTIKELSKELEQCRKERNQ